MLTVWQLLKNINIMVTASSQFSHWHGITRDTILWFSTFDNHKCTGCDLCFATCGGSVRHRP